MQKPTAVAVLTSKGNQDSGRSGDGGGIEVSMGEYREALSVYVARHYLPCVYCARPWRYDKESPVPAGKEHLA